MGFFDDDGFRRAVRDYRFLLDRGYPEKPVQKLVGDRYRLTKEGRMVLYRGVLPPENARLNAAKRVEGNDLPPPFRAGGPENGPDESPSLTVDAYNVILTCMNYLLGKPVFISDDGFIRDIGGMHGRIYDTGAFRRAAGLVLGYLAEEGIFSEMVLDGPVYNSGRHRRIIEEETAVSGAACRIVSAESADGYLREHARGAAATSDSEIIGLAGVPVFDLAAAVIRARFGPGLFDLRTI